MLLSPDWLMQDGLVHHDDFAGAVFPDEYVDYERVMPFKQTLLDRAWERFRSGTRGDLRGEFEGYCDAQSDWLDDFALFVALKARHGGLPYPQWPAALARYEESA